MTSSAEDFTSDDLLNAGFSSPTTTTTTTGSMGEGEEQPAEEEQPQPIEIPRGSDDNSEWEGSQEVNQW